MKDKIKLGVIGLGGRGRGNLGILLKMHDIEVTAVCDLRDDYIELTKQLCKERVDYVPFATRDHAELLKREEIDAVMVFTGWNEHLPLCVDAMNAGKYVATEVGGANSIEQCWEVVRTSERTKMPCMLLENCCYGRNEMTVLNMVKKGVFGELIHAEGGYLHDLQSHIATGYETGHFRTAQNKHRNGELYPTHEMGPIAKCLNINRGNRMIALTSVASKARGLNDWTRNHKSPDHPSATYPFANGDVTTTIIKCAHGETIVLNHNTSLPRPYSRKNIIQGTRAIWMEDKNSIYIDGISPPHQWEPIDKYYEEYEHPLWKAYREGGKLEQNAEGHGGMDYLVLRAFVEAVKNQTQTPIDVYDTATWMAITCLSEDSVALGGQMVAIPDFTNGKWFTRDDAVKGPYSLDIVCDDYFN